MPTDLSTRHALPAPTIADPWGLGGQRLRELRDAVAAALDALVTTVSASSNRVYATTAAVAGLAAGAGTNVNITFPAGKFSGSPYITVTPRDSSRLTFAVTARTATTATVRVDNFTSAAAGAAAIDVIAVGPV